MWLFFSLAQAMQIYQIPRPGYPPGYLSRGYPPQMRSNAEMTMTGNALYIHGGFPLENKELWMYNLTNNQWKSLDFPDLNARVGHGMFAGLKSQVLYIFGGIAEQGMRNDLIKIDLANNQVKFKKLAVVQQTGYVPIARSYFGYCNLLSGSNEYLVIYGGYTGSQYINDISLFNISASIWVNLGSYGNGKSGISCNAQGFYFYNNSTFLFYNIFTQSISLISPGPDLNATRILNFQSNFYFFQSTQSAAPIQFYLFRSGSFSKNVINVSVHSFSIFASSESLYLFGGFGPDGITNQLLSYSPVSFNLTVLSSNLSYPGPRIFSSAVSLLGYYYLIGGIHQNKLLNDVWRTSTATVSWEQLDYNGYLPKLAYHSTCIYANSLIIFGGLTDDGLSNSLYQLDYDGGVTQILAKGDGPTARMGSCIVANDSDIFIFGGETRTGINGELWNFNLGTLEFFLLDTYKFGIAYHVCEFSNDILQIMYGKTSNGGYNEYIISKDLNLLNDWVLKGSLINPGAYMIATSYYNYVVKFGGNYFGSVIKEGEIYDLNTMQITNKLFTDFGLIGAAFTVFNKSLFTYGGNTGPNGMAVVSFGYLSYQIYLENLYCNKGTKVSGSFCEECPGGTYSDKIDSADCIKCPKGTYSSNAISHSLLFCMPCPYGQFGPTEGLSACFACPTFSYCPVGASAPQISYTESAVTSINPNLSDSTYSVDQLSFIFQILFISLGVFAVVIYFGSPFIRKVFKRIDIFKINHNNTLNEPMILTKTEIGGCFTILFLLSAMYLTFVTIIYFVLENETISQALVPLASIINNYPDIKADIVFLIKLSNFGAACPLNNTCNNILQSIDMKFAYNKTSCYSVNQVCYIRFLCSSCHLGSFPHLKMNIEQSRCFTSEIEINITSDSGIENTKSSLLVKITPSDGKVLIGQVQSVVNIDVILSVFQDISSFQTGFYVISSTEPVTGSEYTPSYVPFYNTLLLDIVLSRQNSALLTLVTAQQTTTLIFSGLLGGITGVLQIIAYFMETSESIYEKLVEYIKSRKKVLRLRNKTEKIKDNFDRKSILATKTTIMMTESGKVSNNEITIEDY